MKCEPLWLRGFQKDFSKIVEAPLLEQNGNLTSDIESTVENLFLKAAKGVELSTNKNNFCSFKRGAVQYNRQFWFRIFTVLHSDFPLVCHILGYWHFNKLILDVFAKRGHNDVQIPEEVNNLWSVFVETIRQRNAQLKIDFEADSKLFFEALDLDAAFLKLLWTKQDNKTILKSCSLQSSEEDVLERIQLVAHENWVVVSENWNLCQIAQFLRESGSSSRDELKIPSLKHETEPCFRLLRIEGAITTSRLLDKGCAFFLNALQKENVGNAIDSTLNEFEGADFETLIATWMQESVRLNLWKNLTP